MTNQNPPSFLIRSTGKFCRPYEMSHKQANPVESWVRVELELDSAKRLNTANRPLDNDGELQGAA